MLTDTWIIAQLLAQTCSVLLLFFVLPSVWKLIKSWNIASHNEVQINLERRTFLVGAVLEMVLLFQGATLIAFLVTTNEHLPTLLRGAMCATGALSANEFGYPLLYLKIASLFVYLSFLFLHFLDKNEPSYPLTPRKYWLVLPAFLCVVTEFVLMILYFAKINPDLIATCCSVSFFAQEVDTQSFLITANHLDTFLIIWIASGVWLGIQFFITTNYKGFALANFLIVIVYLISSVYTLKFFFVKYIYGLPSHLCLFDIFFQKYYYVGYILFFNLLVLSIHFLHQLIFVFTKNSLQYNYRLFWTRYKRWCLVFWVLSWLLPCLYYWTWEGTL